MKKQKKNVRVVKDGEEQTVEGTVTSLTDTEHAEAVRQAKGLKAG